jgi:aryl-alcohol dehydrogenase-like predicted oxidoreductase
LGGWHPPIRGNHARPFIQRALEGGINFFDTANRYSLGTSEEILGRAIKDFTRRDEVVIATKVYGRMRPGPNGGGLSRKTIMREIDDSLRRLGTDYVDLYQIHRWDSSRPGRPAISVRHRCMHGSSPVLSEVPSTMAGPVLSACRIW